MRSQKLFIILATCLFSFEMSNLIFTQTRSGNLQFQSFQISSTSGISSQKDPETAGFLVLGAYNVPDTFSFELNPILSLVVGLRVFQVSGKPNFYPTPFKFASGSTLAYTLTDDMDIQVRIYTKRVSVMNFFAVILVKVWIPASEGMTTCTKF